MSLCSIYRLCVLIYHDKFTNYKYAKKYKCILNFNDKINY